MADERHNPYSIVKAAGELLSVGLGGQTSLSVSEVFHTPGSIVIRCHVVVAPANVPETLIVKKVKEYDFGYDPNSPQTPNPAHWLFNDWAAAQFLSGIPSDPPLAPFCYGGNRAHGFVVLEDLGRGEAPNTADLLLSKDPALAEHALTEHAALIGQLHAATTGRFEAYRRVREALGPVPNPERLYQDPWSDARMRPIKKSEIDEAIECYHASFEALGIRPRSGVADEIESITAAVEENPVPVLAYCKGDQNGADDYIWRGGKPRFFDFGAGGFRHALIEGMPGRMTWGCMMGIPSHILPMMERAYQSRLAQGYPEASDDRMFRRRMIEAGARWNVFHVVHRLPDALAGDRQRGPTSLRQQTVAWIESFANLSEELGAMRSLGKSARDAARRLSSLWPGEESRLPYYPAFR